MRKVRVGVIGVGRMGRHHARVYSELEEAELVAVADINRAQALKVSEEYDCNYYQDYETMINKEKLEAVSIAVPSSSHKQVALKVMSKGVNILIEKPIALSTSDAQEIIEFSKKKKTKLMVGHIERFNPVVAKLKELITTGFFGEPIIISATRVGTFPKRIQDTNVIMDLAVHDIDVIAYLFGDIAKSVYSQAILGDDSREHAAQILLDFDSNRVGVIQTNWITPSKRRGLSINCTKGFIEADYLNQQIVCYTSLPESTHMNYAEFLNYRSEEQIIKLRNIEPLKIELSHFINCVLNDTEPLVTGEAGLEAVRIALSAIESVKQKKLISLKEDDKAGSAD